MASANERFPASSEAKATGPQTHSAPAKKMTAGDVLNIFLKTEFTPREPVNG